MTYPIPVTFSCISPSSWAFTDISPSSWSLYFVSLLIYIPSFTRETIDHFEFSSFSLPPLPRRCSSSIPQSFRTTLVSPLICQPAPFGQSNKTQEIKGEISERRNSTFGGKILWNTSTSTRFVHEKKMLSPGSAVMEKTRSQIHVVASRKTFYGTLWCLIQR